MSSPDPVQNAATIAQLIVAIVSLILSVLATALILRYRQELSLSEQIANIPDLLHEKYVNCKIEFKESNGEDTSLTVREVRNRLRTEDLNQESFEAIQRKTLEQNGNIYNSYAYQTSIGLENIGLAVLVGAIPIKFVLPEFSCIIVEDWRFCRKLVEEKLRVEAPIRVKPRKTQTAFVPPIFHSRRHAEWLAYAAALYVNEYLEIDNAKDSNLCVLKAMQLLGSLDRIREREKQLREFEDLPSKSTSKEIEKFLRRK